MKLVCTLGWRQRRRVRCTHFLLLGIHALQNFGQITAYKRFFSLVYPSTDRIHSTMSSMSSLLDAFSLADSASLDWIENIVHPKPYTEWEEQFTVKSEIPDRLSFDDPRLALLVHVIRPSWCTNPSLFAGSRLGENNLSLDKIDKTNIKKASDKLLINLFFQNY